MARAVAQTRMPKAVRRYLDAYPSVKVVLNDWAPGQFFQKVINEQVRLQGSSGELPIARTTCRPELTDCGK